MPDMESVPDGTYKLSSIEVTLIKENLGNAIKVSLDNERAFYGFLDSYDDHWLYLKNNGKSIMIKRRKISSLAVV